MARVLLACLTAAIIGAATPATAVPGGAIGLLPQGAYVCEVPGEASDPFTFAGRHVPEADFEVIGDSSYRAADGRGVYLLTGERVTMTSGPLRGRSFQRASNGFLRVSGGGESAMRCVRSTQAVALDPALGQHCPKGKAALARREPGDERQPRELC
ncbi:MAG: hypothetical protein ABIT04_06715 [Novosphingobium sp.]